jgi:excisionase family DNA binding protein
VQGNRGFAHDHENRLLSIQAVAEISGLHEITIRRYVRSGELEAVRIGRRTESRQGAVEIYAEFAIIPTIGKSEL